MMDWIEQPVSELMTVDPASVHPTQRLSVARHGMMASGGHHVPVVEDDRFIGLLTPSDLLQVAPSDAWAMDPDVLDRALDRISVRHAMQEDVVTIAPDATVREACQIFARGGFHCLPVVDERGTLRGLLTTTDILRALLPAHAARPRPGSSPQSLRGRAARGTP
jgi:CBS domain-containing protein